MACFPVGQTFGFGIGDEIGYAVPRVEEGRVGERSEEDCYAEGCPGSYGTVEGCHTRLTRGLVEVWMFIVMRFARSG